MEPDTYFALSDDAVTAAPASAPVATVIRAVPGQPWPEPPHGGSWSRDPKTGDLTLVQASAAAPVHDRREPPQPATKE